MREVLTVFIVLAVVGVIVALVLLGRLSINRRRNSLLAKYGDPKLVDALMRGSIWQGQTAEQLVDSLGPPPGVDRKVYKNKTKETWKYGQTGRNRFRLRVTVENNEVVGWEQR
jgi:hypothetical protein